MKTITNVKTISNAEYRIYINSDKNPRTINTPMMGRTYFDIIIVKGENLFNTIFDLIENDTIINEIRMGVNTRILVNVDKVNDFIAILK